MFYLVTSTIRTLPAADPIEPFKKPFEKIYHTAIYIFRRVQSGLCLGTNDFLPGPIIQALTRNPAAALTRVQRALDWLDILHQTLRGSREYLRRFGPPRRPPLPQSARAQVEKLKAENRDLRGLPPLAPKPRPPRPSTEDSRDLQRRARIRRILQRDTIGTITCRICRGLGIKPDSDSWPAELANNSQTPERFLLRYEKPDRAQAHPPAEPPSREEYRAEIPYHRRE